MIPCILHPRGEAKRLAGSTDAAGSWERLAMICRTMHRHGPLLRPLWTRCYAKLRAWHPSE
jgi:hypothetical protein